MLQVAKSWTQLIRLKEQMFYIYTYTMYDMYIYVYIHIYMSKILNSYHKKKIN